VLGVMAALLSLLAWPRLLRPLASLLVVVSALNSHFMWQYGAVIDPTMMANVVHTDVREVRDLMSWSLPVSLLLLAGPPLWWIWRRPVAWRRPLAQTVRNLGGVGIGLAVALAVALPGYPHLASLARNHKPVRYMVNPLNTVYASARLAVDQIPQKVQPLIPVGEDAVLARTVAAGGPAPLLVLVVGETARAANWGLNGYARPTTPVLADWQARHGLVNFPEVSSCGTNTQVSVPCMFSPLSREEGGDQPARHENLLDVLQRAGLAVVWIDNQSGCKGVCARVPSARPAPDPALCEGDECLDDALVHSLDRQLAALDPQRRARGTVLVLHMMGSHGPAYFKRAPADRKPFQPECTTVTLADCQADALRNSYDNSIAYTDHVLGLTLDWLTAQARSGAVAPGLLYVSDHGESLGEGKVYLHGLPYAFAPVEQKRVPMVAWLSPPLQQATGVTPDCLRSRAARPASHDHLFHSVFGLMGVQTRARDDRLNLFQPCGT
jgi:lipid A ethanolaminephosphotransferase